MKPYIATKSIYSTLENLRRIILKKRDPLQLGAYKYILDVVLLDKAPMKIFL